MNKEDCKFEKIPLIVQHINERDLMHMLETIYNTVCFSTFPYLIYKTETSMRSLQQYNSGNCIVFAESVKLYLKKNFNIKSYIIGASVPSIFKVPETPHICHCAVVIPISLYEFYILDCALYFLTPMYCSLKDNKVREIYNSNCHNHEKTKIRYQIKTCETCMLDSDYNQIIPPKTICVNATFVDLPAETWNYYLTELKNPDSTIGHSFLSHKNDPFLMFTRFEDNIVKMKYKIVYEDGVLTIRKYPEREIIYEGDTYDNNDTLRKVFQELHPYFAEYII